MAWHGPDAAAARVVPGEGGGLGVALWVPVLVIAVPGGVPLAEVLQALGPPQTLGPAQEAALTLLLTMPGI